MAILGYDTKDFGDTSGLSAGRMYVSKYTLSGASIMSELHGWFSGTANTVRIVIYADSAGSPGTRLAYTSALTVTGGDIHLSETGFSVSLPTGDYWIGFYCITSGGSADACAGTGGTHKGVTAGAANPPADPFPTVNTSGTRKHSMWAVVTAAGSPPVTDFTGTPTSGTASLSVAFTDTSTGTPTSWAWTFGDGGTSTSQNPTHSYTTPGVYTVVLTATNAGGSNAKTRTSYITVTETIVYVAGGGIEIY